MKGGMGEKFCLITGASSGIGKATAMGLGVLGSPHQGWCINPGGVALFTAAGVVRPAR